MGSDGGPSYATIMLSFLLQLCCVFGAMFDGSVSVVSLKANVDSLEVQYCLVQNGLLYN